MGDAGRSVRSRLGNADSITKQAAVLGLVSYAAGLLTINGYLMQFGVADFDIIRPRFALIGLITIGIVFVYPFTIWTTVTHLLMFRERDSSTRLGSIVLAALLLLGPAFVGYVADVELSAVVGLFGIGLGFDGLIFVLYRSWFDSAGYTRAGSTGGALSRRRLRVPMKKSPAVNMVFVVFLATVLLAAMMSLVIRDVITDIPEQFGGVRPRPVVVVVKEEAAQSLAYLSDPDVRLGARTRAAQFDLLYEAQSFILIRTSRGTIWLNKDNVVALYGR